MNVSTRFHVALITHRGRIRADNQDAAAVGNMVFVGDMRRPWSAELCHGRHALVIADGIGGQPAGATASRAAVEFLRSRLPACSDVASCEASLHAANEHIYEMTKLPEQAGMGTTIAGVVVGPTLCLSFNVGDSRVYRFGPHGLTKLSRDDVMADGARGPGRGPHALTQALGGSIFPLGILPHVEILPVLGRHEGILLCTDGLTDAVAESDIVDCLLDASLPEERVAALVRTALEAGAPDNLTVMVASAEPCPIAAVSR